MVVGFGVGYWVLQPILFVQRWEALRAPFDHSIGISGFSAYLIVPYDRFVLNMHVLN
jgi:hypothetical protein